MLRAFRHIIYIICATLAILPLTVVADEIVEGIPLGLYVDDSFEGHFPASLAEEEPSFAAADLAPLLRAGLEPAVFSAVFPSGEAGGERITLRRLRDAGLDASFEFNLLEVFIKIPPELRKTTELSVLQTPVASLEGAEKPAAVSGYLNLFTRGDYYYQYDDEGGTETGLPLSATAEPMLNLFGYVAEGEISFESEPDFDYEVYHARIVRDIPESHIRLSLGSIEFPSAGMFQAPALMAGAAVVRDPEFAFNRRPAFSSRREILLQNPATVTVLINGQPFRTFRLPAGRHAFDSFPFQSGLNSVVFEIREEGRPPRYEEYSAAFDADLLRKGEFTYFASAGAEQWTTEKPLATGFFRAGVLDLVTLGLHAQASGDAGIVGLETILASPVGNLRSTVGAGAGAGDDPDFGASLQYRLATAGGLLRPVFGFGATYVGRYYLPPGSTLAQNPFAWTWSSSVSMSLPARSSVTLRAAYKIGREDNDDLLSGSLGFSKSFGNGFSLYCSIGADHVSDGGFSWRGNVYLSSNPPNSRRSFHLNHDIKSGATAEYRIAPQPYVGTPGFSATFGGLPFREDAAAYARVGAQYNHEFFESSLSDTLSRGANRTPAAANNLSWSAASAIAFADGAWGVTRPIRDGFAIVVPGKSLKDKEILINHGADFRLRTATDKMSVVLPNLRAYQISRIRLNVPDLPLEQQAEVLERLLAPTYKTGYALRMETVLRVFGGGRLMYGDGTPVALQAGEVYSLVDDSFEPMIFYTEENGAFQFYDLLPGTFGVRMYMSETAVQEFTIPADKEGFFYIGNVKIPGTPP